MISAKDKEISALQATTAFLMRSSQSLAKIAESAALSTTSDLPSDIQKREQFQQAQNRSRVHFQKLQEMQRVSEEEMQSLKDAGAAPEVIRAKKRAAEEALLLAMAAD